MKPTAKVISVLTILLVNCSIVIAAPKKGETPAPLGGSGSTAVEFPYSGDPRLPLSDNTAIACVVIFVICFPIAAGVPGYLLFKGKLDQAGYLKVTSIYFKGLVIVVVSFWGLDLLREQIAPIINILVYGTAGGVLALGYQKRKEIQKGAEANKETVEKQKRSRRRDTAGASTE